MMIPEGLVAFTLDYYEGIIAAAKARGYAFSTLARFVKDDFPSFGRFVLRHDLDASPTTLKGMLDREERQGVASTVFVRVTGNTYNPFDYRTLPLLDRARGMGCEIGLHSNFVESADIHGSLPESFLGSELGALRAFFPHVRSLACHRDYNYVHNSLPYVERRWPAIKERFGLDYQAYDPRIMGAVTYVNETVNPRLGWRTTTPEEAIDRGTSVILSVHPHWWFERHPFEA